MASRPITPSHDAYTTDLHNNASLPSRPSGVSSKHNSYLSSGLPGSSVNNDHPQGAPREPSLLAQSTQHENDEFGRDYQHESAAMDHSAVPELQRSSSQMSQSHSQTPSRGGTLKKKASLKKTGSLMRTSSRRSSRAGSVRSLTLGEKEKYGQSEEMNSVFYCPVPTSGSPTELLANRFQSWRKVLKDLITYFRDVQKSYDGRAKALQSASSAINGANMPSGFLSSGGLGDAINILKDYNRQSLAEGNKAREIETEIISQLTGLRSDLQQKIKEIKSLSGDFKSSVDREQESTKRAVRALQEALGSVDHDSAASSGKGDPFIVKMGVDRQVEKHIEEENYLHRAYLNLESSGRELESIVVGEIQKAYSAYAGILKREADEQLETSERLREGPLAVSKDHEWKAFVEHSDQMVGPNVPLRSAERITYPGKDHPAAIEVKSGMLERKSKYLKNYTPGWYILSPTHLHEYKSADRVASQTPIMSLFLPEQKLGSHSEPASSSHKFMLKGRQTGSMHRGHTWILRAESHDTMMGWFADIKELTEKTGEQRNEFVRRTHARSVSGNSLKAVSIGGSSDGAMEEDEADRMPYSSEQSVRGDSVAAGPGHGIAAGAAGAGLMYDQDDARSEAGWRPPQRPSPGGRFPSDVNLNRGLEAPNSPSSGDSLDDRTTIAAAHALPGSDMPPVAHGDTHRAGTTTTNAAKIEAPGAAESVRPTSQATHPNLAPGFGAFGPNLHHGGNSGHEGEWLAPLATGAGVTAVGAGIIHHHNKQHESKVVPQEIDSAPVPLTTTDHSAVPVPVATNTSLTDSPTHTHPATTSSQGDTMDTVSTGPTSAGQSDIQQQNPSYFGENGIWTAPHTNTLSSTGEVLTPQAAKVDAVGLRPVAKTAKSVSTISDLHIPGEYPSTVS